MSEKFSGELRFLRNLANSKLFIRVHAKFIDYPWNRSDIALIESFTNSLSACIITLKEFVLVFIEIDMKLILLYVFTEDINEAQVDNDTF